MPDEDSGRFGEATKQARDWARNFKLRQVGDTLGGWARKVRDLAVEVTENVGVPEAVREATEQARGLRLAGDSQGARALLRGLVDAHRDEPALVNALALGATHERFVDDRVPGAVEIVRALAERLDEKKVPALRLLEAAELLAAGRPERAVDVLRRSARALGRLSSQDQLEARLLAHLIGAAAHRRLGAPERAIREVRKAAAALPPQAGEGLRRITLSLGVDQLLAEGRTLEAERWIQSAHQRRVAAFREQAAEREADAPAPPAEHDEAAGVEAQTQAQTHTHTPSEDLTAIEQALLARVLAARGERGRALALVAELPETAGGDPSLLAEARVRVTLAVGDRDAACREALAFLQRDAQDPERLRLWALAELRRWRHQADDAASGAEARVILESLLRAFELAPEHARAAQAQELAHVALLVDDFSPAMCAALTDARRRSRELVGEELRLHRIRTELLAAKSSAELDPALLELFGEGPPYHLAARAELVDMLGPDELSPLRDPLRREALVAAQRELAVADRTALAGPAHRDAVERALVAALTQDPELAVARRRLAQLSRPAVGERLEDLLAAATQLLAKLPDAILGAALRGPEQALSQVIAARERLARPLTIAIMGEFSAGKSTFVNALLGEAVAPMGVLPTTNTINVFRRGTGRGARVHYRDGSIATVSAEQLDPYLRNLDGSEADRIRHLEIDRVGERMGDAAVVDTPGLNALDEYHEKVAREFIEEADAVVWMFSATQGGTATEAGILAELRAGGRKVLGILNKVDVLDSPAEREELASYLRSQLGEVLVEVLPLSARAALDQRTAAKAEAGDLFAAVDDALERHFLRRARELKVELTTRRLREALSLAKAGVEATVAELEGRDADQSLATALARATAALGKFSDDLHEALLGLDDALAREALALGLVEAGEGVRRRVDAQDSEYLEATLEDLAMRVLRDRLADLTAEHEVLAGFLVERLVPWARGYLVAAGARGYASEILASHGRAASRGETALRAGLRAGLRPLADDWRVATRELFRELEGAVARARQRSSSAPRAEALRLRSSVLAGLDGLIDLLDQVDRRAPLGGG